MTSQKTTGKTPAFDDHGQPAPTARLAGVDMLRGLVMVLMALDHVRDFFSPARFAPEDLSQASPELFVTRWVTHLCAPVFVLLAGTGTYLFEARGRSKAQVSRYLLVRGLWLVVLELTLVNAAWHFERPWWWLLQVIWVLGLSMIALSGLIYLPRRWLIAFSLAVIAGHNLLDDIDAAVFGRLDWLWAILHSRKWIALSTDHPGIGVYVLYPLVPWFAVMAAGYAIGPLFEKPAAQRTRPLVLTGIALTIAFVGLRAANIYGDPSPWQTHPQSGLVSVLSFLNTTKYPPSLLFLCMTLGPAFLLLAAFDRSAPSRANPLLVFGRVPLFFYLAHLPAIHLAASLWSHLVFQHPGGWFLSNPMAWPPAYRFNLARAYGVWIVVTIAFYFICRWYMHYKQRKHSRWMKYL